jgi:hypothetical protein
MHKPAAKSGAPTQHPTARIKFTPDQLLWAYWGLVGQSTAVYECDLTDAGFLAETWTPWFASGTPPLGPLSTTSLPGHTTTSSVHTQQRLALRTAAGTQHGFQYQQTREIVPCSHCLTVSPGTADISAGFSSPPPFGCSDCVSVHDYMHWIHLVEQLCIFLKTNFHFQVGSCRFKLDASENLVKTL